MRQGFFPSANLSKERHKPSLIPRCGACGLYKHCLSPKMPVTGEGRRGILIVAEAPGSEEDEKNVQLIGPAGQVLRKALEKFDVDLDRDCWKTNALTCRPIDSGGNRKPKADEIDYCRPNLLKAIRELNPRIIIPLGEFAVKSLIAPLWDDVGSISKWVGWKIPAQKYNAWITPTFHPSYVLRSENLGEGRAIKLWFERHLESAVQLEGRPWKKIPDYADQIEIVLDPEKAAKYIRNMVRYGGTVSFDLETNRLKPHADNAEIVCCSICHNGEFTLAYPWVGQAIEATGELLQSPLPKIGANTKFEDGWSRKVFGHPVNNWVWDVVNSAHHLDSRSGITSVKFQAFVRLGQEDWSSGIKPYFEATDESGVNRIREIDLRQLLRYCGLDSLLEYKIAKLQQEEMNAG